MTTNIQALDLISTTVEIATSEDWRDSWPFNTAGAAAAFAAPGNVGNGTVTSLAVVPGAPIGNSLLTITSINGDLTEFVILDENANIFAMGTVGVPFNAGGISFTLNQGGTAFAPGDSFSLAVLALPIDLTGLSFYMELKASRGAQKSLLKASTAAGTLVNGLTGGTIGIAVPQATLQAISPGTYVAEIIATDGAIKKRVVDMTAVNVLAAIAGSAPS